MAIHLQKQCTISNSNHVSVLPNSKVSTIPMFVMDDEVLAVSFDTENGSCSFFSDCWRRTSDVYRPFPFWISMLCEPISVICPFCITPMTLAFFIVERRWAMTMVVRPRTALSRASWTTCSDSESSALVASSRRRMVGALIMARAIAILCFCPPEI